MNTSLANVTDCPGNIIVPVEVVGFEGIVEFQLKFTIPLDIDYLSFENAAFTDIEVSESSNTITISYMGSAESLSDNNLLSMVFSIEEQYAGQSFDLEWIESDCFYLEEDGAVNSTYTTGQITTELLPLPASSIYGMDSVCIGQEAITYETSEIENATSYYWQLTPNDAGVIDVVDELCHIDFDNNYFGEAVLTVYGQNSCGTGVSSEYEITILPEPIANVGDNDTICNSDYFETLAQIENYDSVLWQSSGDGYFENPEEIITNYFPGTQDLENGAAILKIDAFPMGPCMNITKDSMLLSILYLVEEVSTPNGPEEVDIQYTPITQYYTYSINADQFIWYLTPPIAGDIDSQMDHANVEWNPVFSGEVKLSVIALNYCNEIYSDSLNITVENSVGLSEYQRNSARVMPNPSMGVFYVLTDKDIRKEQIKIYSLRGKIIKTNIEKVADGLMISMLDCPSGIYLLKLNTLNTVQTILVDIQ